MSLSHCKTGNGSKWLQSPAHNLLLNVTSTMQSAFFFSFCLQSARNNSIARVHCFVGFVFIAEMYVFCCFRFYPSSFWLIISHQRSPLTIASMTDDRIHDIVSASGIIKISSKNVECERLVDWIWKMRRANLVSVYTVNSFSGSIAKIQLGERSVLYYCGANDRCPRIQNWLNC